MLIGAGVAGKRRRGGRRGVVIAAGVVVIVIAIAAAAVVSGLVGGKANAAVGDCFDPPTSVDDTYADVVRHPCDQEHGAEVIFVGTIVRHDFPDDGDFAADIQTQCPSAFRAYTGVAFDQALDYDLGAFTPSEDSWKHGDRGLICYLVRIDEGTWTGSVRGTLRSAQPTA
jgi:hypothetical protein